MALLPGGVHQTTSLMSTPHEKPYIIYRQTSDVSRMRGDDGETVRTLGYMIFVHDVPGDYLAIETIMARLQVLFRDIVDQVNGVIKSLWLETSEDFRDDDMGTITKFARLSIVYRI
jgi:hypothetical protein